MIDRNELKQVLINELESYDNIIKDLGFTRSKKSTIFKRNDKDVYQEISFNVSANPKYSKISIAHIYPVIRVELKKIQEIVFKMTNNEQLLVSYFSTMESIIPKEFTRNFYSNTITQFTEHTNEVMKHVIEYAIPLLNVITDEKGLINFYFNDKRCIKDDKITLHVIASFIRLNQIQNAQTLLNSYFSKSGQKNLYHDLFEYFNQYNK